jgi:cytochrome c5
VRNPSIHKTLIALAMLGIAWPAANAQTQSKERAGKEIVDQVCASCHRTGVDGAPRIGDKEAWSKRAARGLSSLTQNALNGIRKMPPHGGHAELSDTDIRRAITYMVNQSGGHWVEPVNKSAKPAPRSGEQVVKMQCIKCHGSGVSGAPRIDDRAAWAPRMSQGLDATVRSAANGHGAMPARGGLASLTDEELRAAILYMFYPAGASLKPRAEPVPADPNHKSVGGVDVYIGVSPAATAAVKQPHPSGRGYYYVNITLRDAASRQYVRDADVQARTASPVAGGETKKLERVSINEATSYGNFFRMEGVEPYSITVSVRRPGDARPLEASFGFKP